MTLEQLAQKAMDYLDSVGVAAEYHFGANCEFLYIETDSSMHIAWPFDDYDEFMNEIKARYPVKSPN